MTGVHLRIRYKIAGGHVHCRVFSGRYRDHTHGKNGELCFTIEEWSAVFEAMQVIGVEMIDESDILEREASCACET